MGLHLFGIRHHGPGCARSLVRALDELHPDILVLEFPADAQDVLPWATHSQMEPPVALLLYPEANPAQAVYLPLAVFSPEWQALRWAAAHQVPVRLMDLPMSHQLPLRAEQESASVEPGTSEASSETEPTWRTDPLALLAEAAGYADHELWWDEQIERRQNATHLFAAILETMRTVRAEFPEARDHDLLREAWMRRTLRAVRSEGHREIAVVCGAWHAPVLDEATLDGRREGCRAKDDAERLKGMAKQRIAATWIPWTHSRLTFESGYGAGIASPGWYGHLWSSQEQAPTRWLTSAARLLRENDLDASSASLIEASRLAETLAALRDRSAPGLTELNEAILTVLCHGQPAPMTLIHRRLSVGQQMGRVPEETPAVPLAGDLSRRQSSLRLKPSPSIKTLDLDLRKETDLARSHLLHQLQLLSIPWGQPTTASSRSSTFHEIWQLEWKPEFAIAVIEANVWGNTVPQAVLAKTLETVGEAKILADLTRLLSTVILAGLNEAVPAIVGKVQSLAASGADVRQLMEALPPLARLARYSDVRGTSTAAVEPILIGLFERAMVGVGAACSALDDDAAERMLTSLACAAEALQTLQHEELSVVWHHNLRRLESSQIHALLRGWCCRTLLDQQAFTSEDLERAAHRALSPALPPAECAAWLSGLLRGSGLLLLHQTGIWPVFDRWLTQLSRDTFVEMLPLLRRAFADFTGPERRQMGEKVQRMTLAANAGSAPTGAAVTPAPVNSGRAARVLPILALILGQTNEVQV